MADQFTDWTLDDINIEECKKSFFPNWVKQWNSRQEAIQGILQHMKEAQPLFDRLGLKAGPLYKAPKKSKR